MHPSSIPLASWADLEAAFRGAGVAMMLVAAVILLRSGSHRAAPIGAVLCLSGALQFALSAVTAGAPLPLRLLLGITGSMVIPLFWLFARAWFDDDFSLSALDGALTLGFTAIGGLQYVRPIEAPPLAWVDLSTYGGGTAFALHTQWLAWRGRNADLVEHRRHIRGLFVVVVGLFILWSIWSEALSRAIVPGVRLEAVVLLNSAVLCALTFVLIVALLGLRHPDIFPARAAVVSPAAAASDASRSEAPINEALAQRLSALMRGELLFRDPGMTIGKLAGRLDQPEYRVRRLINQGLGYRNFNEFLNAHRIEEVRAALADPQQASVSILTIALDAGFGSLPAFNRAFKASCGETPTDFRRRALARG